jgi:hypothetical protein
MTAGQLATCQSVKTERFTDPTYGYEGQTGQSDGALYIVTAEKYVAGIRLPLTRRVPIKRSIVLLMCRKNTYY